MAEHQTPYHSRPDRNAQAKPGKAGTAHFLEASQVHPMLFAGQASQPLAVLGEQLQRTYGNQFVQRLAESLIVQRRPRRGAPSFHQQVFIVRDRGIGLGGGTVVADLAAFRRRVMRLRNTGDWTLVLAIHGSEERLGAQAPPHWQRNAIFYDEAAINRLFSENRAWVRWRDRFGPNYVSLVSCQVTTRFERVLIANLTRHAAGRGGQVAGPQQAAQGLGTGCKPLSEAREFTMPSGRTLRTRRQYQKLPPDERQRIWTTLQGLNRRYGYYGAPPVPDNQILDYFFNEAPRATWVIVEVGREQPNGNIRNTHVPFWQRARDPNFLRTCEPVVNLRPRRARAPVPGP